MSIPNPKDNKKKDETRHVYGFDSGSLENAAKAAKYLDGSKSAKEAFELAFGKEKTKQLEIEENKM